MIQKHLKNIISSWKQDHREIIKNLLPRTFSEFELWFLLPGVVSFFVWQHSPLLSLLILGLPLLGRSFKIAPLNLLTLGSILVASIGLFMQAETQRDQFKQFTLLQRGRLSGYVEGDARYGNIKLVNVGNLPVKKLRAAWKIFKYPHDPKNASQSASLNFNQEIVDVDQEARIPFSSNYDLNARPVFLVFSFQYFGEGIPNNRKPKSSYLLWNIEREPHMWAATTIIDALELKAIDEVKEKLEQALTDDVTFLSPSPHK